jgi:asparagine synthase (glutamine-hydrolysing)
MLADLAALTPWRTLARFLHEDALREGDPLQCAYAAIPPASESAADAARLDLLTYLPGDLMPKADRAAMAYGVETRSPFLDDAFLDRALRVPGPIRATLREGKVPLRAILRGRIPDSVLDRPKHGFAIPLSRSLRTGRLAPHARGLLNEVTTPFEGVLRGDSARSLLEAFDRGEEIGPLVYACLVVALHHETWK